MSRLWPPGRTWPTSVLHHHFEIMVLRRSVLEQFVCLSVIRRSNYRSSCSEPHPLIPPSPLASAYSTQLQSRRRTSHGSNPRKSLLESRVENEKLIPLWLLQLILLRKNPFFWFYSLDSSLFILHLQLLLRGRYSGGGGGGGIGPSPPPLIDWPAYLLHTH